MTLNHSDELTQTPTCPLLYSKGLDPNESQGEQSTDFDLAALGVISIREAHENRPGGAAAACPPDTRRIDTKPT